MTASVIKKMKSNNCIFYSKKILQSNHLKVMYKDKITMSSWIPFLYFELLFKPMNQTGEQFNYCTMEHFLDLSTDKRVQSPLSSTLFAPLTMATAKTRFFHMSSAPHRPKSSFLFTSRNESYNSGVSITMLHPIRLSCSFTNISYQINAHCWSR